MEGDKLQTALVAFGFAPHKRREQPLLQQRVLQSRLRSSPLSGSWFMAKWDVANAFMRMRKSSLHAAVHKRGFARSHENLLHQRIDDSLIVLQGAGDDAALLASGVGCLPGDTAAPQQFAEAYNDELAKWDRAVISGDFGKAPLPLPLHDFQEGHAADLTMTVIADDLARTGYCTSTRNLYDQVKMWDSTLNRHLAYLGISQNFDKKKILVESDFPLLSVLPWVSKQFKYVGSVLSHDGSVDLEIQERIAGAKRAWRSLGRFWSSTALEKFKVTCYRALAQNSLLSGLDALVLEERHFDKLEVLQMRYLRKLMCGGACYKTLKRTLDGRQHVQFQALTNNTVRSSLKVFTLRSEISARRLK